jgi:mevalonate pyrophosphate decarboxylase
MTMRADGRPSGSTVASVIACAFRISANASFSQLARSGSGSSGRSVGRAGLETRVLRQEAHRRFIHHFARRRHDARRRFTSVATV